MYNLKTWVLTYLNGLQNSLNARQDEYNRIMQISDAEERRYRLKMRSDSDRDDRISFEAEKNFNFIQARTGLMPDLVSGHMSEYAPGSLKCQKYSESRLILNQIDTILLQIKAKYQAFKQIRQKQFKQRGRFQFKVEPSEKRTDIEITEQQFNKEISHNIDELNLELSKIGKPTINNPFKKG